MAIHHKITSGFLLQEKHLFNDKILISIINTHHLKTIKAAKDNIMKNMFPHSKKLGCKNLNLIIFVSHFQNKLFLLLRHYTKKALSPKYMHYSENIHILPQTMRRKIEI